MRTAYTLMRYMASVFTDSNSSDRRAAAQSFAAHGGRLGFRTAGASTRLQTCTTHEVTARCRLGDKRGNFGVGITPDRKRAEASDSGRSQIGRHPPMKLPAQSDQTRRA